MELYSYGLSGRLGRAAAGGARHQRLEHYVDRQAQARAWPDSRAQTTRPEQLRDHHAERPLMPCRGLCDRLGADARLRSDILSGSTSVRFTLSYRDVEDILAERGLMISNESIRRWVLKFGPIFARHLRAIRPKAYTWWHLDEGLNRWTANVHVARCRQRRRGPRDPCPAPGKTIERGAYRRV